MQPKGHGRVVFVCLFVSCKPYFRYSSGVYADPIVQHFSAFQQDIYPGPNHVPGGAREREGSEASLNIGSSVLLSKILPAILRLELLFSKKVSSVNRHTHRNTAILQLRGQPRRKIHFARNSPSRRKTRQTPMPLCFYFHKPPSRRARAGRRAGEFIERRKTLRSPRAVLGQARGQELSEHPVQILHLRSPIKL